MLFRLLSVCYFLTSQLWCFSRQNSCRIGSIKMGLYVVREWISPVLCETKRRWDCWNSWILGHACDRPVCVTEPDPVLLLEECCRDFLYSSKAEVTHRQDKHLKKSRWYHGGLFQQYETIILNFVNCFPLNTLALKTVNDFLNANFLIVLTG